MGYPNILLIFTDDQRSDTIHAAGNPVIITPHLDRLVLEGTRYTSAYTPSPVCVPARCSMIYGQYPHKTGCASNAEPMPEDRPGLMEALSEAGYRTHGIGKMHFKPDPHALRGFQSREQQEGNLDWEHDDYLKFLQANGYEHVHEQHGVCGEMLRIPQPAQMPARLHPTNWVGDRAVRFIHEVDESRPFFLWASFIHPHPPLCPPTPWNKLYRAPLMPLPKRPPNSEALHMYINRLMKRSLHWDDATDIHLLRLIRAYYYACISFVDFQIGRLLKALEDTNRLDNTLIMFTSDHGDLLGDYGCFSSVSMLDAVARIPMIVRYAKRFVPGRVCDTPVSLVDIMPTLLSAAGLDITSYDLHGIDLADIAASEPGGAYRDRTVYSQWRRNAQGIYMAVNREWKYFYSVPDGREFLFDRIRDPDETRNRAAILRYALDKMRNKLFEFYKSEGFVEPLQDDGWKLFPEPPPIPTDPDEGLVMRDREWSIPYQEIPGYTDYSQRVYDGDLYKRLNR